jgi:DNA-directed RNA polymerase beta' subunit
MERAYTTPVGFCFHVVGNESTKRAVTVSNPLSSSRTNENDPHLGPQASDDKCMTCAQGMQRCPNHLGVCTIYPTIWPLSAKSLGKIVAVICAFCSRVALSMEERKSVYERKKSLTTTDVREILQGKSADATCPFCSKPLRVFHPVGYPVGAGMDFSQPALYYVDHPAKKNIKDTSKLNYIQLPIADNRYLMDKLEGIPSDDLLISFPNSIEHYHPRTYIKDTVEITLPCAKIKAHASSRSAGPKTKKLYSLIERFQIEIGEKLAGRNLQQAQKDMAADQESFNELILSIHHLYYAICILHWKLPDRLLSAVNTVFQLGAQKMPSNIGMLARKGGIYRKYIAGARHDKNARTPLTGAIYGAIGTINYPREFAMKIDKEEMVNDFNIEWMRALVRNGPKVYPGANGYKRGSETYKLLGQNLDVVAANLIPGDIVLRHGKTGDVVLHGRYPSIREESINSSVINVYDGRLIQMPLANCEPKMADFDGDDTQAPDLSNQGAQAEALMLMSTPRQFIAPYDGRSCIAITDDLNPDVIMGVNFLLRRATFNQREINAIYSALYTSTPTLSGKSAYTTKEILESIIPRGFYFDAKQNGVKSDLRIEDGFITQGMISMKAFQSGDNHLLRAVASAIDSYTAIKILEDVSRIAYKVNEMYGNSCADDARLMPHSKAWLGRGATATATTGWSPCEKIREFVKDRVRQMTEYSYRFHRGQVPIPAGQDPLEYYEAMMQYYYAGSHQLEILEQVREVMKGTSLERTGYAKEYEAKLIPAFSSRGIIMQDGHRPRMELSHSNRHFVVFPKGYDGPEAGYVASNYLRRVSPLEHFLEGMSGRQEIYIKAGKSVAETGYYHRKMYMSMGALYIGHYGEVRGHSATIISFSYGHTGADSRCASDVVVDAHLISDKDFRAQYDGGVAEEFALLQSIRDDWRGCITEFTNITSDEEYDPGEKTFKAPFNIRAFFEQAKAGVTTSTTTSTTAPMTSTTSAKEAWELLKNMDERLIGCQIGTRAGAFAREVVGERVRAFMRLFRFIAHTKYFVSGKWPPKLVEKALSLMVVKYKNSLAQVGDVVGTKAALNITSSLYQSTLHAGRGLSLLKKTVDLIKRTHGVGALREVTEGLRPKFPITMFYLDGENKFSKSKANETTRSLNSVKLNEALVTAYFYSVSPEHITEKNVITNQFLRWIKSLSPTARKMFEKSSHSWFYITLHLNHTTLLINRINPALVAPTLRNQFPGVIDQAIPIYENDEGMYIILMMRSSLTFDEMRASFDAIIDTGTIHGHPSFTNGTVKEYEKFPDFGGDGALKYRKAYRIMYNGSDLHHLFNLKGVEHFSIVTTDVVGSIDTYGIEEGRFRAYEIMAYESTSIKYLERLLRRHLQIVVDYMAYRGTMTYIPRAAVASNPDINEIDKQVFETADVFLAQALQTSKNRKIDSLMSSILFGKAPNIGSGISSVYVSSRELFPSLAKEVSVQAISKIPKVGDKPRSTNRNFNNSIADLPTPMDVASKNVVIEL